MTFSITDLRQHISQTLRWLRRDWAFTAAFVLTLALGIAANAAVFSALDAYFLRPLPYPQGRRLLDIYFDAAKYPLPLAASMSAAGYRELRSVHTLAKSGLESNSGNLLVAFPGEMPQYLPVVTLTASTLKTLDVQPLLGRWIGPAADREGGPTEVEVGYRLWQSAFHADPHAVGATVLIGGKPYTVVGIMPSGFAFPVRHDQLWVSAALTPAQLSPQELTTFNWTMIARLRRGASQAELRTELNSALARLEQSMSPTDRTFSREDGAYLGFMPLRRYLGGATRERLLMMQLGASILLLLAVASLINLALARALRRRDEAALRVVLGAGRHVLFTQALLEALPLAGAATFLAWPLTELGLRTLARFGIASASTPFDLHASAAIWVLALGAAFTLTTAALALPQAFVRVHRPAELLYGIGKDGGSSRRMRPLRFALSVGQIALAIALLASALLLGRSLRNMLESNPGFSSRRLYTAMLYLQGPQYRKWALGSPHMSASPLPSLQSPGCVRAASVRRCLLRVTAPFPPYGQRRRRPETHGLAAGPSPRWGSAS